MSDTDKHPAWGHFHNAASLVTALNGMGLWLTSITSKEYQKMILLVAAGVAVVSFLVLILVERRSGGNRGTGQPLNDAEIIARRARKDAMRGPRHSRLWTAFWIQAVLVLGAWLWLWFNRQA